VTRSQLSRVSARSEELRRCAETVERRVRDSAEDSLEALSAVEARAAALLQAQAADVRRQLEATERCAADVRAALESSGPPLAFLQAFRPLSDACERLALKPLSEELAVSLEEFESEAREAAASQAEVDADVLKKLCAVKDQLIAALLEERDALRLELQARD